MIRKKKCKGRKRPVAVIRMHVVIVVINGIVEPELFKSFEFRHVAS
jgi:hypothetical protein